MVLLTRFSDYTHTIFAPKPVALTSGLTSLPLELLFGLMVLLSPRLLASNELFSSDPRCLSHHSELITWNSSRV